MKQTQPKLKIIIIIIRKGWESIVYQNQTNHIKQYYNLFKYSTKGGDFIGNHTSLAKFVTFDFCKISVALVFVYANFYFFSFCYNMFPNNRS